VTPIPVDFSDGDIEFYPYWENEYDEWGNKVEWIDGFQYIDVDKVIDEERAFNRKLVALEARRERRQAEKLNIIPEADAVQEKHDQEQAELNALAHKVLADIGIEIGE
jgi:hypothetical protein